MAGPFAKRKRLVGGPVSQLVVTGAYSGGERLGACPPPLDFQNLKRKSTVAHHSNRKRDKEEEGYREKEEIYRFRSYDGQTPSPLFPPRYISLSPFLPFFIRNIKQNTKCLVYIFFLFSFKIRPVIAQK